MFARPRRTDRQNRIMFSGGSVGLHPPHPFNNTYCMFEHKHTQTPYVKADTDALMVRRRLCMDDPVGLVPVLEEPGAKVHAHAHAHTHTRIHTHTPSGPVPFNN